MVTTIEQLKQFSAGQEVELPAFIEGSPFICRLGRPSLLLLVKEGRIPNPLLGTAKSLFREGLTTNKPDVNDLAEVMISIAKASMLEPTYQDVVDAGLNLTDDQLVRIYMYVSSGVDTLKLFRSLKESDADNQVGGQVSKKAK